MGRHKLERFKLNAERYNVVEPGKDIFLKIKGTWREYFKNNNEIVLEIGCGRGEYTTGLANLFPNKNFIGIDLKGSRIWKGSTIAVESNLSNVAFLRTQMQSLENFFEKGEVNEIWITFPDPRPKEREEKMRLTSPLFLNIYKNILTPHGKVNFKTDNLQLFEYTLDVLKNEFKIQNVESTFDLYNSEYLSEHYGIQTTYEKKYLQKEVRINFLKFNF